MGVGAALVAEDVQALVHDVSVQVELLAQALHHQLLQIARQQDQAVRIRHDDHVPIALAAAGDVPHGGHHVGRIVQERRVARERVHVAGSVQQRAEVDPGERGGQMPHDAGHAGAAADGFGHLECLQPALARRVQVELAALHGDGAGVLRERQAGLRVGILAEDHVVLRLLRAAGFGDVHDDRRFQVADAHGVRRAGRICVVQKIDFQRAAALFFAELVPVRAVQRHLEQLRTERGPADAVDDRRLEPLPGRSGQLAAADVGGEFLDVGELAAAGVYGPVGEMRDLAVFVRILDLAAFDLLHFGVDGREPRFDRLQVGVLERHSGEIDLERRFSVDDGIFMTAFDQQRVLFRHGSVLSN